MAAVLSAYLEAAARQGSHGDCLLFAADWVRLATGIDPARSWRGTGSDSCEWLKSHGGMRRVAVEAMRGFEVVKAGEPGDVALVRAVGLARPKLIVAAICVAPDRWAVRTADFALTIAGAPGLKAFLIWRVPWRK